MTSPAAPAQAPSGAYATTTEEKQMAVLGLSVIGGLFVGSWAVSHMRAGLEDEERKKMLLYLGAAGIVGAAAWIFQLDERFYDANAALEWANQSVFGK